MGTEVKICIASAEDIKRQILVDLYSYAKAVEDIGKTFTSNDIGQYANDHGVFIAAYCFNKRIAKEQENV